jgi:hypothetical protein
MIYRNLVLNVPYTACHHLLPNNTAIIHSTRYKIPPNHEYNEDHDVYDTTISNRQSCIMFKHRPATAFLTAASTPAYQVQATSPCIHLPSTGS